MAVATQSQAKDSHHIVSADAQKQGFGQNIQFVELKRNQNHRILVDEVLKEKISPQMSMLLKIPDKGRGTTCTGVKQAEQSDYKKAIKAIEQSTKQIIRAIRMAGVYISE